MRRRARTAKGRPALRAAAWLLAAATLVVSSPSAGASGTSLRPGTTTTTSPGASPMPGVTTTTTAVLGPAQPAPAPVDTCVKRQWQADVQGAPASFVSGADGAYLWYDPSDGGWSLSVTHSGPHDKVIYSGSLTTTTGRFIDVQGEQAGNDIVALSSNHRSLLFRFVGFGGVDSLNFGTRCVAAFKVSIHVAGHLATPAELHLGAAALAPPTNPFRVTRAAS